MGEWATEGIMSDEHLIHQIQPLRHRFRMAEFYAIEKCEKHEAAVYRSLLDDSQGLILRGRYEAALKYLSISENDLQARLEIKPKPKQIQRQRQWKRKNNDTQTAP